MQTSKLYTREYVSQSLATLSFVTFVASLHQLFCQVFTAVYQKRKLLNVRTRFVLKNNLTASYPYFRAENSSPVVRVYTVVYLKCVIFFTGLNVFFKVSTFASDRSLRSSIFYYINMSVFVSFGFNAHFNINLVFSRPN